MCYCINPDCKPRREIINTATECPSCHTRLLINNRYLLVRPLRNLDIPHPYAEVFEVEDQEEGGKPKVLKVLKNNDTKLVELFNQEANFLIGLIHPGIPRAEEQFSLSLSTGQELHCLVMEKIEGQNLEQWLKQNNPIDQEQALEWMRQLVKILDYLHQNRFFHRDIKPSNIMHKPDGTLVLIDFGTAREVTQTVINGHDVTVVYSSGYTAPEQIQGHAVPQSDFFALGRTFVHLLTGRHPIELPKQSGTSELIWRDIAPQVSPSLADFIDELMAPSVQNRPDDTQTILQRLKELLPPPPPPHRHLRDIGLIIGGISIGVVIAIAMLNPPSKIDLCKASIADDVSAIDFRPDGKYIGTASLDKTVQVLEITNSNPPAICQQHTEQHKDGVVAVKFSPDGKYLATASLDSTAGLGEISKDGTISNFKLLPHGSPVVAIDFTPKDGKSLATASSDGIVKIWDTKNHRRVALLDDKTYVRTYVRAVSFSQDGRYLAIVSLDNKAGVWDWKNPSDPKEFVPLPEKNIVAVAFSPKEGKYLATASADGTVKVWDTTSYKEYKEIARLKDKTYVMAIKFSPDGRYLAPVSLDNKVKVWEWEVDRNGQKPLSLPQDNVVAVAFSPKDGKYLATASDDGTAQVWETANGGHVKTVLHGNSLVDIAFSPRDDEYLVTASADGTIKPTKW